MIPSQSGVPLATALWVVMVVIGEWRSARHGNELEHLFTHKSNEYWGGLEQGQILTEVVRRL